MYDASIMYILLINTSRKYMEYISVWLIIILLTIIIIYNYIVLIINQNTNSDIFCLFNIIQINQHLKLQHL